MAKHHHKDKARKHSDKSMANENQQGNFVNVSANFTAYMCKNTVSVSVNNKKTNALCDTGATVSCISWQYFDKAFAVNKPKINPCQINSIVGVGGTHHKVQGVINIEVKFGSLGLVYPFYVIEDLHHSLILGHDFMESHNVTLDIRGKKMILQDNIKVCSLQTNTGYARTVKPVVLPANSEVDIQVKIARVNNTDEVLLEPLSNLVNNNIMGAKCLVKVNKGRAAIRLINPGDKCVHLKGNKVLAVVSEVVKENIFSLSSDAETKPNMSENSSKHNSKFHFDLDNSDLNESQKQTLLNFLNKNDDLFSEGLHDLGRTLLTQKRFENVLKTL